MVWMCFCITFTFTPGRFSQDFITMVPATSAKSGHRLCNYQDAWPRFCFDNDFSSLRECTPKGQAHNKKNSGWSHEVRTQRPLANLPPPPPAPPLTGKHVQALVTGNKFSHHVRFFCLMISYADNHEQLGEWSPRICWLHPLAFFFNHANYLPWMTTERSCVRRRLCRECVLQCGWDWDHAPHAISVSL